LVREVKSTADVTPSNALAIKNSMKSRETTRFLILTSFIESLYLFVNEAVDVNYQAD
jgi:hypothetical protein